MRENKILSILGQQVNLQNIKTVKLIDEKIYKKVRVENVVIPKPASSLKDKGLNSVLNVLDVLVVLESLIMGGGSSDSGAQEREAEKKKKERKFIRENEHLLYKKVYSHNKLTLEITLNEYTTSTSRTGDSKSTYRSFHKLHIDTESEEDKKVIQSAYEFIKSRLVIEF